MIRAILSAVLALGLVSLANAADPKPVKSQMVKGTVKSVDVGTGVLVISQVVKEEKVDRQLSITDDVQWEIKTGTETKTLTGKDGLAALAGKEGSMAQVKCDKDVKVLKVTVTLKK